MANSVLTVRLLISTVFYFQLLPDFCHGQTYANANDLTKKLFADYNKHLRPVESQSDPIIVNFDLRLISLSELCGVKQQIHLSATIGLRWTDEMLRWDPDDHNNLTMISVSVVDIWTPSLLLVNSISALNAQLLITKEEEVGVLVTSDGNVTWMSLASLHTTCPMNMEYFPNDEQNCALVIFNSGYLWEQIQFVSKKTPQKLFGPSDGQWELRGVSTEDIQLPDPTISAINITVTFQRYPGFFVMNLLFPINALSCLSVLVWFLPGEKVSYVIKVLLAVTIFLGNITTYLPPTSLPIPLITRFLTILTVISVLSVVAAIFSHLTKHVREYGEQQENDQKNLSNAPSAYLDTSEPGDVRENGKLNDKIAHMSTQTLQERESVKPKGGCYFQRIFQRRIDFTFFAFFALAWIASNVFFLLRVFW